MARSRNIKPGFYKNEDLAECSVWARFIFPGLWMMADREGRLEDRPKRLKAELLPFDSQPVEPLLCELAARNFIVRYQIDGASYIQISKFLDHQSPHYSEKPSSIKPYQPPEDSRSTPKDSENPQAIKGGSQPPDSLIPDSRFLIPDSPIPELETSPKVQRGEARATRLPADWRLATEQIEWALVEQPTWDAEYTLKVGESFRDHWHAKPGKDGTKLDWDATWRNWVRREGPRARARGGNVEQRNAAALVDWVPPA